MSIEHIQHNEEFSFNADVETTTEFLTGATLHTTNIEVTITEVEGYNAEQISNKIFKDAQNSDMGVLTAVPYRATMLPNITVRDKGLVMIREVEYLDTGKKKNVTVSGPGKVANILGLQKAETARLIVEDSQNKVIRLITREEEEKIMEHLNASTTQEVLDTDLFEEDPKEVGRKISEILHKLKEEQDKN